MIVSTEVNYEIAVKATLREDGLSLAVSASAPYGERTATATVDTFSDEVVTAVRDALQAAIDEKLNDAVSAARLAAMEAHLVAAKRGEL